MPEPKPTKESLELDVQALRERLGGYPELHSATLAANTRWLASVQAFAAVNPGFLPQGDLQVRKATHTGYVSDADGNPVEDDTEQAAEGVTPESALAAAAAAPAPKKEKKGPVRIKKEEAGDAPF